MGYNIANWEMIRTREELAEKLGLDGGDDTHSLLNNMVDVRACYKPSGKVRFLSASIFFLRFSLDDRFSCFASVFSLF